MLYCLHDSNLSRRSTLYFKRLATDAKDGYSTDGDGV